MGLLDDIINSRKKEISKHKKKELPVLKEGRTWKQIAQYFVREVKHKFDEYPEGFALHGKVMRELVGNPNSNMFRKYCKDYGIKVTKVLNQDIYRIEKHDKIGEELKKRGENSSLL